MCERLSVMQDLVFCVQKSLSATTEAFKECDVQSIHPPPRKSKLGQIEGLWISVGSEYPPLLPKNENWQRLWDFKFESFQNPPLKSNFSQSRVPEFGQGLGFEY